MKKTFFAFALLFALSAFSQTMPLERGVAGQVPFRSGNTAADTASLAPGQMSSILTGTPTAAANYTTPTATQLCALFPFVRTSAANLHWDWWVKNTSAGANTITVVGGSGVTITGTATVAQNAVKHFMVVLDNCVSGSQAAHIFSLGTSTF
jgi:hypothetical protein